MADGDENGLQWDAYRRNGYTGNNGHMSSNGHMGSNGHVGSNGHMDGEAILVIDGELQELDRTTDWLRKEGYSAIAAEDMSSGLRDLYNHHPDAVILALDETSGNARDSWMGVQRIRELCDIPIILVTSRASRASLQKAFDLGLDGYLVRPLDSQQLLGRLASVLRKARNNHKASPTLFRHENLSIDWKRIEVRVDGHVVHLSPTEFKILSLLVERRGWVLTYDQILDHVWGSNYIGDKNNVKLYVWYLRRKLEADPSHPRWILTRYGIGYTFVDEVTASVPELVASRRPLIS